MGDPTTRAAQLATGVEDLARLRMMGVHVPQPSHLRRGGGGARPDRATLHRVLTELGLPADDVRHVHWYTARRPVARVDFRRDQPVVLKWLADTEWGSDNEAWALGFLAGRPLPDVLRRTLPRPLGTAANGQVQCFAHVDDAATWSQVAAGTPGAAGDSALDLLGTTVAALHALPVEDQARAHPDRHVRFPVPSMARLTPAEYALGCGSDFTEYAATMQALDDDLGGLRDSWAAAAYIHFDLREDNVLFGPPHSPLTIVDWELAGFGDPAYDLGTMVGQLLARHLPAPGVTGSDSTATGIRTVQRLVSAYQRAAGVPDSMVVRSLRFAGVFLLLGALGRLEKVGALGRVGHLYLLIGQHVLRSPERVLASLAATGSPR